jgi:hypothetical protein
MTFTTDRSAITTDYGFSFADRAYALGGVASFKAISEAAHRFAVVVRALNNLHAGRG